MISIKISGNNFKNVIEFLTKYIKENTTCKVNESNTNQLIILIEISSESPSYYYENNNLIIHLAEDKVDENYLKTICKSIFNKFNIDSLDIDISFKDIDTITDVEDKLAANYDKDYENKVYLKDENEPNIELHTVRRAKGSMYYFTRRKFSDEENTKYAGESLIKAVAECDKYAGMKVFNEEGKLIYRSNKNKINPNQNYSDKINRHAILSTPTGTGIYVVNEGRRYHIPDGTEVIVTKINNSQSEIVVTVANQKIKANVMSSCLQ